MDRRTFVRLTGAATTAAVAGCTSGTDHGLADDAWDGMDDESDEGRVSGNMALGEGEYAVRHLEPDQPVTYDVEFDVVAGEAVDVFFLDRSEYDERYRDGEGDEIQYYSGLSVTDSSGDALSGSVSAGDYALVLDNAGVYGASPDGEATVDLTITSSLQAARRLASAEENVEAATSIIEDDADAETEDFNADEAHARLDDAEADLDAAEGTATEEQRSQIDQMRLFTAWLRSIADAMGAIADGLSAFETGASYFEAERYDDAVSRFDESEQRLQDADEYVGTGRDAFADLDESLMNEYASTTGASVMDELESLIGTLLSFTRGFRDATRGFDRFMTGAEAFDDEDWDAAVEAFEDARDRFESAESTLRDSEENAPPDVVSTIIEMTCLTGAMRDGSEHYVTAAEAAGDGNFDRANHYAEEGQEALDQCE